MSDARRAIRVPDCASQGTPLDDAIRYEHNAVKELLEARGAKIGARRTRAATGDAATELCDAASKGNIPQLRALIEEGLDVNTGDYDRRTALHLAASEGLLEVVTYLVDEAEADPSPLDRRLC